MLMKKLKKVHKSCRKHGGPVLESLATYVEHVMACLEPADECDVRITEYRNAVARLDLSAMIQARDSLAAPPAPEAAPEQPTEECAEPAPKKRKKKEKVQPAPVEAESSNGVATEPAAEIVAAKSDEKCKKAKKEKKKAAKTR